MRVQIDHFEDVVDTRIEIVFLLGEAFGEKFTDGKFQIRPRYDLPGCRYRRSVGYVDVAGFRFVAVLLTARAENEPKYSRLSRPILAHESDLRALPDREAHLIQDRLIMAPFIGDIIEPDDRIAREVGFILASAVFVRFGHECTQYVILRRLERMRPT